VGTLGRIDEIGEPQHGAIPLTVAGEARFRIAGLDRSLPYLVGHVEELDGSPDPEAQVASETLARVANRYVRLLMASHGQFRGPVHLTGDPGEIERLAGQLLFNHANEVRQAILEAEPLSSRLRMMRRTLSRSVEAAEAALMRGGPGREPTVFGIN
jgi:Lon protease-like protein